MSGSAIIVIEQIIINYNRYIDITKINISDNLYIGKGTCTMDGNLDIRGIINNNNLNGPGTSGRVH